jgi:hypothetical protein
VGILNSKISKRKCIFGKRIPGDVGQKSPMIVVASIKEIYEIIIF